MAGLVILQVERAVDKAEVGEQPLGAHLAGKLEQIIVGVAGVVVDAFLHAEDLNGEDRRFTVAQARVRGQQYVAHHHTALGADVCAVVDGRERRLRTGAGMHGIQVVNERLHGLIGSLFRLFQRECLGFFCNVSAHERSEGFRLGAQVIHISGELGPQALFSLNGAQCVLHLLQRHARLGSQQLETLENIDGILLFVCFGNARRQAVVKVYDALAAVLVVLIGLDGDTCQGGITLDVVGLAQKTVARGETAFEQLEQVDLAAGGGEGVKIKVMDMDPALPVRPALLGCQQVFVIIVLGCLAAVLKHGAHGRVAVDVGVAALHVAGRGVGMGQLVEHFHQTGVHLAHAGAGRAVQNIFFGGVVEAHLHQLAFHFVLDLLDLGRLGAATLLQSRFHCIGDSRSL